MIPLTQRKRVSTVDLILELCGKVNLHVRLYDVCYGLDPYSTGIFGQDIVLRAVISEENLLLSPMVKTRPNLFFLLKCLFCHNNNYISAIYDKPVIPT